MKITLLNKIKQKIPVRLLFVNTYKVAIFCACFKKTPYQVVYVVFLIPQNMFINNLECRNA